MVARAIAVACDERVAAHADVASPRRFSYRGRQAKTAGRPVRAGARSVLLRQRFLSQTQAAFDAHRLAPGPATPQTTLRSARAKFRAQAKAEEHRLADHRPFREHCK